MNTIPLSKDFLSSPALAEHLPFLEEIGVVQHIEDLGRRINAYKSLLTGAMDIFNRTTIDKIIDATVRQISDQFLPSFIVFLWKPHQNKEDITIRGFKNYKIADLSLKIENIVAFEPFFHKSSRPVSYSVLAKQMHGSPAIVALESLKPEVIVPIVGPSGLYGLILVGRKTKEGDYTAEEMSYIQQLMTFVSQAIQNHLHYEHSVRDVKTGLFNHGFFMTRMNEEIARTKRNNSVSSLIVIDVDKFKNFNDAYGHLAGDQVLESLARTIKQNVRLEDVPSRFGGEEFTILLPDTGADMAYLAAERLRNSVAGMKVPWDPPLPQVTISLGVVTFSQETNIPSEGIISRADEALYLSKERGRNRTSVWEAEFHDHHSPVLEVLE